MSAPADLLRERITLQRPTLAPDDLGAGAPGFSDVAALWGQLTPMGDDATPGAWRIALRLRRDVRPGWRVSSGARRFSVRAVVEADADLIHLYCQEEQ